MRRKVFLAALAALAGGVAMAEDCVIEIGNRTYPFALNESESARSLAEQFPLAVTFEDYGSTERIAYLKKRLSTKGAPASHKPERGDVAYYAPWGNLAIFRKPFDDSPGLILLGRIPDESLKAVVESGSQKAVLRRAEAK
jgi:hypothetical protein